MKKKSRNKKMSQSKRVLKLSPVADAKLKFWATLAGHREYMGIMMGKRFKDHDLVADVVLMYDQTISSGSVVVSPKGMRETHREIKEKYKGKGLEILGWCHSHGHMSAFQSSVDDDNTREMLRHIGTASLYVKLKDGSVVHCAADSQNEDKSSGISKDDIIEYLGFCYTLTINSDFEMNSERWLQHVCPYCDRVIESTVAEVHVEEPLKTDLDLSILKDQFEARSGSVHYYGSGGSFCDEGGNGSDDGTHSRCQVVRIQNQEDEDLEDESGKVSGDDLDEISTLGDMSDESRN